MQHAVALDTLEVRWHARMRRLGIEADAASPLWKGLIKAYTEPGRHYHTLEHLVTLFGLLDEHGGDVDDRDAIELVIFFHDAVYDPARSDNEAASAALAGQGLTPLGLPVGLIAKVEQYILATQHSADEAAEIEDADLALLLDLDLAILAQDAPAYADYVQAIRKEYAHLSDEAYRAGRRRVLQGFLDRARIYRIGRLHAMWDVKARANLAAEIEALQQGSQI